MQNSRRIIMCIFGLPNIFSSGTKTTKKSSVSKTSTVKKAAPAKSRKTTAKKAAVKTAKKTTKKGKK